MQFFTSLLDLLWAEMQRRTVLLFLEEEGLLRFDWSARHLDEDLHLQVSYIHQADMFKAWAGNEGELLLVKVRQ